MVDAPVYQYGSNETLLHPPIKWTDNTFNKRLDEDHFDLCMFSYICTSKLVD